ncbi:MAG: PA14 domain-containing protein, partial [Acidimicrobiales bacterium]
MAGLPEPNGYARRVVIDAAGRLGADANAAGEQTGYVWDPAERLVKATDPAGRVSTTVYDHAGRPTDTFGPGAAGEFGADNRSASAPHASTAYDEGIAGLAATYWPNISLSGPPIGVGTGVGNPSGSLDHDWGNGAPASIPPANAGDNFSARFSGEIALAEVGTYSFRAPGDDGVRVFIDDTRVVDAWYDHDGPGPTGSFANAAAGSRHRIVVEYYDRSGPASVSLQWATPAGPAGFSVVPGASLSPRYGLVTSTTDADGRRSAVTYAEAALGLATATVLDPGGLGLRSTTTYEAAPGGYFRRTARTLPKGAATASAYAYFGDTETADDPCTPGTEATNQAGALRSSAAADPDGAGALGPIVRQYRYDGAGRTVASRAG